MASRIEVTISELQDAATKIEQYAEDYLTAANNLKAAADQLASTWEGDSQVAFVTEQENAYNWYRNMASICKEYAAALRMAAQKYQQTDAEAVNCIRNNVCSACCC